MCPIGALGFYLMVRLKVTSEFEGDRCPDFTNNASWYNIKLLKAVGTSSGEEDEEDGERLRESTINNQTKWSETSETDYKSNEASKEDGEITDEDECDKDDELNWETEEEMELDPDMVKHVNDDDQVNEEPDSSQMEEETTSASGTARKDGEIDGESGCETNEEVNGEPEPSATDEVILDPVKEDGEIEDESESDEEIKKDNEPSKKACVLT